MFLVALVSVPAQAPDTPEDPLKIPTGNFQKGIQLFQREITIRFDTCLYKGSL